MSIHQRPDRHHGIDAESLHSRRSFLNVISLFGPAIFTTIVNRHGQRDMRLITEADKAVVVCMAERGPSGASEAHIRLKTQVELYTILCTEYRCVRAPVMAPPQNSSSPSKKLIFFCHKSHRGGHI